MRQTLLLLTHVLLYVCVCHIISKGCNLARGPTVIEKGEAKKQEERVEPRAGVSPFGNEGTRRTGCRLRNQPCKVRRLITLSFKHNFSSIQLTGTTRNGVIHFRNGS